MKGRICTVAAGIALCVVAPSWHQMAAGANNGPQPTVGRNRIEPLLLDVGADGFALTSVKDGVSFDLDGDGTSERLGWTSASGNEAFLAIDSTRTGAIENGRKLLGGLYDGQDGFTTLERLDADPSLLGAQNGMQLKGSRTDAQITEEDPVYQRLVLWQDGNHDGIAEGTELKSAASIGLQKLYYGVVGLDKPDQHGNVFRFSARALILNQHGVPVASEVRPVVLAR